MRDVMLYTVSGELVAAGFVKQAKGWPDAVVREGRYFRFVTENGEGTGTYVECVAVALEA